MTERLSAPKYMAQWSEYSEKNHESLKAMYESRFDADVCIKAGNEISMIRCRGSLHIMQALYYVFHIFLADSVFANRARAIEVHWHGIGGWMM